MRTKSVSRERVLLYESLTLSHHREDRYDCKLGVSDQEVRFYEDRKPEEYDDAWRMAQHNVPDDQREDHGND